MTSAYDTNSIDSAIAEGRVDQFLNNEAKYGRNIHTDLPTLNRMAVLDVIHDPTIIDDVKVDYWQHTLGVINIQYARTAPRNSIIAQRIIDGTNAGHEPPILLFPLFPSHVSLPCKAGEHVWVVFESPQKLNDLGYWLCKIATPHFVDDVNHTHSPREHDPSFVQKTDGSSKPQWEFNNGVPAQVDGSRITLPETAFLPGDNNTYDDILRNSDASKITQYESVPRYRKRPSDFVLEGSNNTLIVLGTDRSGPSAQFSADSEKGQIPQPVSDDSSDHCGCIDIVVGRGQTSVTAGNEVLNVIGRSELNKETSQLNPTEGDPDFIADRSRVHISQRVLIDKRLGINKFNKDMLALDDDDAAGGIFVKSDKIRVVAREDIQLLVTGFKRDDQERPKDSSDTNGYTTLALDGSTGDATLVTHGKCTVRATGDHTVTTSGKSSTTSDGNLSLLSTSGDVSMESKKGSLKVIAKNNALVEGKSVMLGINANHPAPLWDDFLTDLNSFLSTLINVLTAGTAGSPVKQQLVALAGAAVTLNKFVSSLNSDIYKSKKVTNE